MRPREVPSRLVAVVAVRQIRSDRIFTQLARRVMQEREGRESVHGTWSFSSSITAVLAARELSKLGEDDAVVVVLTGESQGGGHPSGSLSERALSACKSILRPGVYVCSATQALAMYGLPPYLWLYNVGSIAVEPEGVEYLSLLCTGSGEPDLTGIANAGAQIPKPLHSFIGRHEEQDKLYRLLVERFIVTITGLPGIGKSAVAAAVAGLMAKELDDGVFWVDVGSCSSEEDLIAKLQRATRAVHMRHAEPLPALVGRLKELSALIVFDNCEMLLDEVRGIVKSLVDDTTQLGVMVTSTISLQLPREHVYMLPPLSLPVAGAEIEIVNASAEEAVPDAFVLFSERAQAARVDFELTTANVEVVAELCRGVAAIPLAIEILASKLGSRNLGTLSRQLPRVLTFQGNTGRRSHHRSLKQCYEHALSCVSERERELITRLSLFSGPFSFEQAACVWSDVHDSLDLADDLDSLWRASLLTYDHEAATYSILAPLRIFLDELMQESAFNEEARIRFCTRVFDVMEGAKELFDAQKAIDGVALIKPYQDDIEAAIRMVYDLPQLHSRLNDLLRGVLPHYWHHSHRLMEIDALLEPALTKVQMSPTERVACLNVIGASRIWQQDLPRAEACFLESLALIESSGQTAGIHAVLGNLAFIYKNRGEFEKSVTLNKRALAFAREENNRLRVLNILLNSVDAIVTWFRSNGAISNPEELHAYAQACCDEAASLMAADTEPMWTQSLYHGQGELAFLKGDLERSEHYFILAALTCEQGSIKHEAIQAVDRLVEIDLQRQEYVRAAKLLGYALSLRVETARFRPADEEHKMDGVRRLLSQKLGKSRVDQYVKYGASAAICDLCVLKKVTY